MAIVSEQAPRPDPIGGAGAPDIWNVVVVGGGNAGLAAALSASVLGGRVLVLERAEAWQRGGNTRHTRNVRCAHQSEDAFSTGSYTAEELWQDLVAVGEPSDEHLARLTVAASDSVPGWMREQGVAWQPPTTGTLQLGRTNRFFLGGGKALLNSYYHRAESVGVTVAYEARVEELFATDGAVSELVVVASGRRQAVRSKAVVCAAGGFEGNLKWLEEAIGPKAANFVVRGPAHNDGTVLRSCYDLGAQPAGTATGFHAVAVDARSPRFDGGIATRLDCIPFAVVLDRFGRRFADEGADLWPKRYASWGGLIGDQDGQVAYAIWDAKVTARFLPPMYGPLRGETPAELAESLGISADAVTSTIDAYNAAVVPGRFDPEALDDCRTEGLDVEKSHWAQRIDQGPYFGVAMRPGITFTYRGVAIDEDARVRRVDGTTFPNLFAAGEMMSGNILSAGYLAGFGLTIGTVWGRIAGTRAAELARG